MGQGSISEDRERCQALKMYYHPYGVGKGPRIELVATISKYRRKKLPNQTKFEETMEALIEVWGQC